MNEMFDMNNMPGRTQSDMANSFEMTNPSGFLAETESSYPEIFHRLMPYVSEKAAAITDPFEIRPRDIERMADEVLTESGVMMNPPRGHSSESMRDVARMLMTAEIDRMYDSTSALFPIFAPPFFFGPGWGWGPRGGWGWGRGHWRG